MYSLRHAGALALALFVIIASGHGAAFVAEVTSYLPGTGASLTNPAAAIGSPSPVVSPGTTYEESFNPFSPPYESSDIVQIATGGQITLRLQNYVQIDRTPGVFELGVFENVGLTDTAYPNGTNSTPAGEFGSDYAVVEVSADGVTWYTLNGGNRILFQNPGNYYLNAQGRTSLPADKTPADFGKPFTGSLSDFDGKTFSQVMQVLNGSAGGTWLDLDSVPISVTQIGFVRFSNPSAGPSAWDVNDNTFELDAVSINSALVGAPTPEPGSLGLLLASLGLVGCLRLRRS